MQCAGTVIRDDLGLNLEKVGMDVLGTATKVVITNKSTLIVTDGSTRQAVEKRVSEIRAYAEVCFQAVHRFYSHLNSRTLIC